MSEVDRHAYALDAVLEKTLDKHADRTALVHEDEEVTYRELDRESNALANALAARGVGLEDRVGLLLPNSRAYVVSDLAVVKAGATRLPVNGMLTDDEIEYILSDANAKGVVCDPESIDLIYELMDDLESLEVCIAVTGGDEPSPLPAGIEAFAGACAEGEATKPPAPSPRPEHVAAHFYTSGTTGKPKGVVHTHRSVVLNLHANAAELDLLSDDRQLLMTPLTHSAGVSLWSGLLRGATAVVRDGFDADRALADIGHHDVTWTYMVPTMIYRVLDRYDPDEHDLSALRTLAYGSAPMSPSRLREGLEVVGPVFVQFYAQTEIPQVVTTLGKREHKHALKAGRNELLASAGKPCLMADVKIVDPETGESLQPTEEGEIAATAPYRMREYHNRPDATRETLREGWVHTGDMGKRDEDGNLYLLGRKDDMIITGGMNVYPAEVEDALGEHPDVGAVAVVGVPHDDWGEAVTAFVVPAADAADLTESDVLSFADEVLADYKKPKSVSFRDKLPTTSYGKVDKQALRAPYWETAERDIS
jgi:fatty-acyl-CoA synthase/long-chain acyl-CoA synthetase